MKSRRLILATLLALFMLLSVTAVISYAVSKEDEELVRKIDGRRYTCDIPLTSGGMNGVQTLIIDVRGKTFVTGIQNPKGSEYRPLSNYEIKGREAWVQSGSQHIAYWVYTISEDGSQIIKSDNYRDGHVTEEIFLWQK